MTNALKRITPEDTVLVLVDYVTGLDNLMNTIPARQYKNNIAAFIKLGDLFDLPTAIFGEENEYYGKFLPELEHAPSSGVNFHRTQISCYIPEFADWLAGTGRRSVLIGGISIDNCVLHTVIDLLNAGYHVQVVADVSGTNNPLSEQVAMTRMRDAGAVMTNWLAASTELAVDFSGPYGEKLMGLISTHWPASTVGEVEDTTPDGAGMQLPA